MAQDNSFDIVSKVDIQEVRNAIDQAMKEIREKSPTIKAQLDAGTVGLVGAIYDVSTGKVTFLPD